MTAGLSVEQVLRSGVPEVCVDQCVLAGLLRSRPSPEAVVPLLSASDVEVLRAVVVYLGVYGSMRECPLLALHLQHEDAGVSRLAEHSLWSIWMQSGTPRGNRCLARAIRSIENRHCASAIQALSRLTADEPGFAEAFFQRGIACHLSDRLDEAVRDYRQALRLNPHHFGAAAALGHVCVEQGNTAGALLFYKRALRINPRLEGLPDAVLDIESLSEPRGTDGLPDIDATG